MGVYKQINSMKIEEVKANLEEYLKQCESACALTKTAFRNKKSLSGENPYGRKFHDTVVSLSAFERNLIKMLGTIEENVEQEIFIKLADTIKSPTAKHSVKSGAMREITLLWRSDYLPRIESLTADPVPETEQVLPAAVVENTRGYIERVVLQANGCYEHQWYDSCAVMIRRLVETLIIEMYQAKGKQNEIKDGNDNYQMLSHLVDKTLNDATWNLGRETKATLPLLKSLGDRSAHNRTYLAKKGDIDKIISGLRVVADEFLHSANLK